MARPFWSTWHVQRLAEPDFTIRKSHYASTLTVASCSGGHVDARLDRVRAGVRAMRSPAANSGPQTRRTGATALAAVG